QFMAGTANYVEFQTAGADGVVIVDGVRFVQVNTNCDNNLLPSEIIIDNDDGSPTVSEIGDWDRSTIIAGYYGPDYIENLDHPDAEAVRFTPNLPSCGNYEVYGWWTTHPNRATNTPIIIHDDTGTDNLVRANQQENTAQWNLLGTYQFAAGSSNYVEFRVDDANGVVIADAVRFVQVDTTCSESEIVIDNLDGAPTVTLNGSWTESTVIPGFWEDNYIHDRDTPDAESVRFTPEINSCGTYNVYAQWTSDTNRATNTPIVIRDANGPNAPITVNQEINGGQWNLLGSYPFAAGTDNYVEIQTDGADGVVIVDAVRFVQIDTTCSVSEIVIDNLDSSPAFTKVGTWIDSTIVSGYWSDNYIHNENSPDAESVRFTPTIDTCGTYEVFARWTEHGNRATNTPIVVHDGEGFNTTSVVNQQTDGGEWNSIGVYPFAVGTSNYVEVQTAGADGVVIADAVRFMRTSNTCPEQTEMIIDNRDGSPIVTTVGTWFDSTIVSGFWADNYIHNEHSPDAQSVRFTPTIGSCGQYEVFTRWTTHQNRATNTPIVIHDWNGTNTTVTVNQEINGGQWNSIGVYSFASGTSNYVEFQTAGADDVVIVDAVRLVKVSQTCNASPSTAPTAAYLAIPDGLTGVNGSSVSIPVNVEEANVATSAAFTLNFNPSCLSVNTADGNNDGLPDAITLNQADDYVLGVNADNASNGTVRFVVSPPGTTSALPTFDVGALVTVNANVQCNSNTAIAISDYSFGGIDGQPVNALAQGNTISMLQAPVAVDDTGRSEHGATILIDVLANDDSTLDIISVTQPANGTVTIQSGQVQYVPNTGFAGVDTFSYTVRDGNGLTDSSQVQIGVGTTSDCNHQGTVEAADLPAIILEIFDGDSNNWLSVEGGSFGGNPVGCDSNASSAIEAGDISCTIRHLLGESTCTLTARSARQQAAELTVSDSWTIENEQVTIPIEFISHGNRIGAVSMSLDIEPSQLIFDTETGVLNIPDGYQASVNVRGRTLGIVLFTMNLDNALQDGEIASLTFDLVDGTIGQAELSNAIGFSMISDTTVGGVNGQSVPSISHPQRGAVFVPSVWK
ncbi:MAG: Ig-like domain-containing protein, partial [Chloroflexota bacterium]